MITLLGGYAFHVSVPWALAELQPHARDNLKNRMTRYLCPMGLQGCKNLRHRASGIKGEQCSSCATPKAAALH